MDDDKKKEAVRLIAQKVQEADAAIREAERLADEFGLEFSSPLGRIWGMGGTYYGTGAREGRYDEDRIEDGWVSSAGSC